jgi:DNA-binding HxlR family transcriptional regulator
MVAEQGTPGRPMAMGRRYETERDPAPAVGPPPVSTADLLRLLASGAGAAGEILMVLGREAPLRTKELTAHLAGYAPRTVYRYASRLAEISCIAREEERGVPSKVVHALAEPGGRELFGLIDRFMATSEAQLPGGRVDPNAWMSLGLLADLWESGMVEQLSCGPRSLTELTRGPHEFSFHQVDRRTALFEAAGLLRDGAGSARRRSYALTGTARRMMGLVAGIGYWRHRHCLAEDEEGMSPAEIATLLRTALPLVRVPRHAAKILQLDTMGLDDPDGAQDEGVWAEVDNDGAVEGCSQASDYADGWARGNLEAWLPLPLEGDSTRLSLGGDTKLVSDCLRQLHKALWLSPRQIGLMSLDGDNPG